MTIDQARCQSFGFQCRSDVQGERSVRCDEIDSPAGNQQQVPEGHQSGLPGATEQARQLRTGIVLVAPDSEAEQSSGSQNATRFLEKLVREKAVDLRRRRIRQSDNDNVIFFVCGSDELASIGFEYPELRMAEFLRQEPPRNRGHQRIDLHAINFTDAMPHNFVRDAGKQPADKQDTFGARALSQRVVGGFLGLLDIRTGSQQEAVFEEVRLAAGFGYHQAAVRGISQEEQSLPRELQRGGALIGVGFDDPGQPRDAQPGGAGGKQRSSKTRRRPGRPCQPNRNEQIEHSRQPKRHEMIQP